MDDVPPEGALLHIHPAQHLVMADAAVFIADDGETAGLVGRDRDHHFVAGNQLQIDILGLLIASGALTSATYSGMACTTFPDCSGAWWPRDAGLSSFNPWHIPNQDETLTSAAIHMAHRYLALCTVLVIIALCIRLMRQERVSRTLGSVLLALALTQVTIGIAMLARSLPMVFALSHNIVASLLLSTLSMTICMRSAAR